MDLRYARRSGRLTLAIPVVVWGYTADRKTFFEETKTVSIAAHGGRLLLSSRIAPGQRIVAYNRQTQKEMGCRVVHVQPSGEDQVEAGIEFEFLAKAPDFWQVQFPPDVR
jgi:hypothetical protein